MGVSDGDTITVMHQGKGERIRLYGIDCPEKRQAFGKRAKQFISNMVYGKIVEVRLMASDINVVRVAEKDLEQLLERFYNENLDMIVPQQYEAAKKDFGYFLVLIEMAVGYYNQEGYDIGTVH